ncbi:MULTISPECIES: hypothetical protein [Sorangium]|uniref:Secreted protein n=1 Tax=Sorangium cellulosum TaxID=56 RepID=A0A4P2QFV0_SORCE|nr:MULTISPECIES: hypothetical protein [Sorangium]AUX28737.1 uncharacterized protein SOCE836_008180 [Sorangium cellulosum]WCQ88134.1 hypothetical protein NQZ70_00806 [Sorangium sp. Soce836]
MTRAIGTTWIRTTSMGAALLALGAGAALLGASCNFGPCPGIDCPDPHAGTCPWRCAEPVWDGSYSVDGFENRRVRVAWVGSPRDAPDCEASNYNHFRDYYQEPKSLDRCPRCVAEPRRGRRYERVELVKGDNCTEDVVIEAPTVSEFVLPPHWDGSCVSQRTDVVPAPDDVDLGWGTAEYGLWDCDTSLSLEDVDALWGKIVRVCERTWPMDQYCAKIGSECIPVPAPGFRECLQYFGEDELQACPRSHPELVRAHSGVEGCTECDYDADGDRSGTRTLTFYADEQCSQPIPSTDARGNGQCFDLPPGVFPRSVSATLTVESIPVCEPRGGEQEGELRPGGVATFCCGPPA